MMTAETRNTVATTDIERFWSRICGAVYAGQSALFLSWVRGFERVLGLLRSALNVALKGAKNAAEWRTKRLPNWQ